MQKSEVFPFHFLFDFCIIETIYQLYTKQESREFHAKTKKVAIIGNISSFDKCSITTRCLFLRPAEELKPIRF